MKMFFLRSPSRWFVCAVVFLVPLFARLPLAAQERVIDMRIIIDLSASLTQGKTGAVNWLCDTVVDRTLQRGDSFYLIASGESAEVIFDGVIGDAAQKEEIKEKIRLLGDPAGVSHAEEALRHIFSNRTRGPIPVTIIVCGTDINMDASLLRYSRTENFAYWRAVTVADGLDAKVDKALGRAR
jgi:hypothetical protein